MMLPSHRHRHATEHASRRWREVRGRRDSNQAVRANLFPHLRYVAFSQKALYELQLADEAFAAAMRLAIARTLSHKLSA